MLTKGEREEQQQKINASALAPYFRHIHIVDEKNVDTYRALVREHELVVETTWMIGNSPKSDIVPARAVGMNAVYIPNANTWALEHTELDADDDRILHLRLFAELLEHF